MDFSHLKWDVNFHFIEKGIGNCKFWLWEAIYSCFLSETQAHRVQGRMTRAKKALKPIFR